MDTKEGFRFWLAVLVFLGLAACSNGSGSLSDPSAGGEPPPTVPPPSTPPPTTPPPTTPPPTTPPPTTPPPTTPPPTPTTPPPGSGPCTVGYQLNQWSNGFTANVTITNRGPSINSWTLTWNFGGNQTISNAWNSTVTQSGAAVTARNVSWNGSILTNASVTFGFQASYSGTNARPAEFRLNNNPCTVA